MKEKEVNRLKVSFSSSILIAGMLVIHHNLYQQLYLVLTLQLACYFFWFAIFSFVKSLYQEYKLFFIVHLFGVFLLGILPNLFYHLMDVFKGYIDLVMVLGAIIIMLANYKYCQDDMLLKVRWKVVDVE